MPRKYVEKSCKFCRRFYSGPNCGLIHHEPEIPKINKPLVENCVCKICLINSICRKRCEEFLVYSIDALEEDKHLAGHYNRLLFRLINNKTKDNDIL